MSLTTRHPPSDNKISLVLARLDFGRRKPANRALVLTGHRIHALLGTATLGNRFLPAFLFGSGRGSLAAGLAKTSTKRLVIEADTPPRFQTAPPDIRKGRFGS